MNNSTFDILTLSKMKDRYEVSSYEDTFLLADNLDDTDGEAGHYASQLASHPIRLDFTLCMIVLKGGMDISINLNNTSIRESQLMALAPGTIGEFKSMQEDTKVLIICSKPPYDGDDDFFGTKHSDVARGITIDPIISLSDSEVLDIVNIYSMMKRKINDGSFKYKKEFLDATAYLLAIIGKNKFENETELLARPVMGKVGARAQEIFLKFMMELKDNHSSERMISFYADKCCVTPKYLSQVVHDVSGKFASDWIRDFVIIDSKALLKSRRYTVQQVADMMGFENASFFGKYFKNATGISPRAYMMQP